MRTKCQFNDIYIFLKNNYSFISYTATLEFPQHAFLKKNSFSHGAEF